MLLQSPGYFVFATVFPYRSVSAETLQLFLVPFCVMGMIEVISYGASKDQWDVTMAQIVKFASASLHLILEQRLTHPHVAGQCH